MRFKAPIPDDNDSFSGAEQVPSKSRGVSIAIPETFDDSSDFEEPPAERLKTSRFKVPDEMDFDESSSEN
jgi:hypothetical protein